MELWIPSLPFTVTMAEVLAVLSTAWRLVGAIRDVVALIKQTEEHGRALSVSLALICPEFK
jgi:hypothetical protein